MSKRLVKCIHVADSDPERRYYKIGKTTQVRKIPRGLFDENRSATFEESYIFVNIKLLYYVSKTSFSIPPFFEDIYILYKSFKTLFIF